jgi:hypothetical protein
VTLAKIVGWLSPARRTAPCTRLAGPCAVIVATSHADWYRVCGALAATIVASQVVGLLTDDAKPCNGIVARARHGTYWQTVIQGTMARHPRPGRQGSRSRTPTSPGSPTAMPAAENQ